MRTPEMSPHGSRVTLLIMAGGRSTRMGRDKAWLAIDGQPLVERIARRLAPLADEVLFSARNAGPYRDLCAQLPVPAAVVTDRYTDAGPLAGLEAGLSAAQHDLLFVVATDMPFVNPTLVAYLLELGEEFDAVIPLTPHGEAAEPEPLHAAYRRTCLPAIRGRLDQGQRRMSSFFSDVRVRYVSPDDIALFDPGFRSFTNFNSPDEWASHGQSS